MHLASYCIADMHDLLFIIVLMSLNPFSKQSNPPMPIELGPLGMGNRFCWYIRFGFLGFEKLQYAKKKKINSVRHE